MAGKAKVDPATITKDRVIRLTAHLEKVRNQLNSKSIPAKHAGKEVAYREFLQRELSRTSTKIEELKLSLPAAK